VWWWCDMQTSTVAMSALQMHCTVWQRRAMQLQCTTAHRQCRRVVHFSSSLSLSQSTSLKYEHLNNEQNCLRIVPTNLTKLFLPSQFCFVEIAQIVIISYRWTAQSYKIMLHKNQWPVCTLHQLDEHMVNWIFYSSSS